MGTDFKEKAIEIFTTYVQLNRKRKDKARHRGSLRQADGAESWEGRKENKDNNKGQRSERGKREKEAGKEKHIG
jgi:hypothetical protein